MKYLILAFTFLFSLNSFADYKVYATQNQKINIPEKSGPWEAPSGEPALHPNGVTVTCLDMPDGSVFSLKGKDYRVVYKKEDAATYAESACTSNITDLSQTFKDNTNFNKNISHWDTSRVTTMHSMFYNANVFNQDIGDWDVSNVVTMSSLFRFAKKFNQDISTWDVSNVELMNTMFYYSLNFNKNIGDWDVSNVITMSSMFSGATMFNQDISDWDVGLVTNFNGMFSHFDETTEGLFNQDLSSWCVEDIDNTPSYFSHRANNWVLPKPNWGSCPQ